jgi:CRP-like cAMP-binding protein
MPTDTVEVLRRVPLFASLDDAEIRRVAREFKERRFDAGQDVTHEDSGGVAFFVIAAGEAQVSRGGDEVRRLRPGDYFGEIALLTGDVRTASVTAVTELHCLVMAMWDFRAFVKADADIAWRLLTRLAELLGQARAQRPAVADTPA